MDVSGNQSKRFCFFLTTVLDMCQTVMILKHIGKADSILIDPQFDERS